MSHVEEVREAVRAVNGPPGSQSLDDSSLRPLLQQLARYWWVELLLGVFWVVVAIVVLKFNHSSVVTVGVLTGIMFLVFAAEEFLLAVLDKGASRWVWVLFGVLLAASGIVALIHPEATFAGFADILGFVFLMIGILWTVQAFAERVFNDLWWLGLISGILMVGLAFWVSGQFFLTRAATTQVFGDATGGLPKEHVVAVFVDDAEVVEGQPRGLDGAITVTGAVKSSRELGTFHTRGTAAKLISGLKLLDSFDSLALLRESAQIDRLCWRVAATAVQVGLRRVP